MADAAAMAKANEPVPDMVKQFVVYFYRHIREKNGARSCPCRRRREKGDGGISLCSILCLTHPLKPPPPPSSGSQAFFYILFFLSPIERK